VNSFENLKQISGLDVRYIEIVYIPNLFPDISKIPFVQTSKIVKTGFVTDQIFPRREIENLLQEFIGNVEKHVNSGSRSEFDFLAFERTTGNDA
jgi:hypothetical protein